MIVIFGIVLLGPSLLYVPTLLALISIQALWGMTCTEIPDLQNPVQYTEQQARIQSTTRPSKHKSSE